MSDQVDFQALYDKLNSTTGPSPEPTPEPSVDLFSLAKKAGLNVRQQVQAERPLSGQEVEQKYNTDPEFLLDDQNAKTLRDYWKTKYSWDQQYLGLPFKHLLNVVPTVFKQGVGTIKELGQPIDNAGKIIPTAAEMARQFAEGTGSLALKVLTGLKDTTLDVTGVGGEEAELERFRDRVNQNKTLTQIEQGAVAGPLGALLRGGTTGELTALGTNPETGKPYTFSDAPDVMENTAAFGGMFIPIPGGPAARALSKTGVGVGKTVAAGLEKAGMNASSQLARDATAAALKLSRIKVPGSGIGDAVGAAADKATRVVREGAEAAAAMVGADAKAGAGVLEQGLNVLRQPFEALSNKIDNIPPELRALKVFKLGTGGVEGALLLAEKALEARRRFQALPASQSGRLRQLAQDPASDPWLQDVARFLDNSGIGKAGQVVGDLTKGSRSAAVGGYLTGALASDDPEAPGQMMSDNLIQNTFARGIGKMFGVQAAERRVNGIKGDLAAFLAHLAEQGVSPEEIQKIRTNEAAVLSALSNPDRLVEDPNNPGKTIRAIDTIYGAAGVAATYWSNFDRRLKVRFFGSTGDNSYANARPSDPNSAGFYDPKQNVIGINLGATEATLGGTLMHELAHNLMKAAGSDASARVFIDKLLKPTGVVKARRQYALLLLKNRVRGTADETLFDENAPPPANAQEAAQREARREQLVTDEAARLDAEHGGDSWVYSEIYAEAAKKSFNRDIMRDVIGENRSLWRRLRLFVADHYSQTMRDNALPVDALFDESLQDLYGPEMRRKLFEDLRTLYTDGPGGGRAKETSEGVPLPVAVSVDQVRAGTPAVAQDADGLRVVNNELVYDDKAARKQGEQRAKAVRRAVEAMPAASDTDTTPDVKPRPGMDGRTEVAQGTRVSTFMRGLNQFSNTAIMLAESIEGLLGRGGVSRLWYNPVGTSARGTSWAADVRRRKGNIPATQVDMAFYDFHISSKGHVLARGLSLTAMERRLAEWRDNSKSPLNVTWGGDVPRFRADLDTYLRNHAEGRVGDAQLGTNKRDALNFFLLGRLARLEDLNPLRKQSAKSLIRSLRIDRMASMQTIAGEFPLDYQKLAVNFSPDMSRALEQSTPVDNEGWLSSQKARSQALQTGAPVPAAVQLSPQPARRTPRADGLPQPKDMPGTEPFPRASQALRNSALSNRTMDDFTGLPSFYEKNNPKPDVVQSMVDVVPKSAVYRDLVVHLMFEQRRRAGNKPTQQELREAWTTMAREDTPSAGGPEWVANEDARYLLGLTDADMAAHVKTGNFSPEALNALAAARDVLPTIPDTSPLSQFLRSGRTSKDQRAFGVDKYMRLGSEGVILSFRNEPGYLYKILEDAVTLTGINASPTPVTTPLQRGAQAATPRIKYELTAGLGSMTHAALTKSDRQSRMPGGLPVDILGLTLRGDPVIKMPELERHATFNEVRQWQRSIGATYPLFTDKSPQSQLISDALHNQPIMQDKAMNSYAVADLRFLPGQNGFESPNVMVDKAGRVYAIDLAFLPIDNAVLRKEKSLDPDFRPMNPDKLNYSPDYRRENPYPDADQSSDLYDRAWDGWDLEALVKTVVKNTDGFTVNRQAQFPEGGYVVAPWKSTEFSIAPSEFNEGAMRDYLTKNLKEFRVKGAHLGGWLDTKNDVYKLDVVFPVARLEDAVKLAIWGNQDAIFDLNKFAQIDTKKNGKPHIPEGLGLNFTVESVLEEKRGVKDVGAFASLATRDPGGVRQPGDLSNQAATLPPTEGAGPASGEPGRPAATEGPVSLSPQPPTRRATPNELITDGALRSAPAVNVDGHWIMSPSVSKVSGSKKKKGGTAPDRTEFVYLDRELLEQMPEKNFETLMKKLRNTSGLFTTAEMRIKDPHKLAELFVSRAKENLRFLWDKAAPWRDRAKQWYDGANVLANDWSKKYEFSINQMAAVLAACSPKTDWFRNIEIAKRIIEGYKLHSRSDVNTVFDKSLFKTYVGFTISAFELSWNERRKHYIKKGKKLKQTREEALKTWEKDRSLAYSELIEEFRAEHKAYIGKTWSELAKTEFGQATLLRAYDVAKNPQQYYVYSPEGKPLYLKRNKRGKKGAPPPAAAQGWTTYDVIRDSIKLLENGSAENIHDILGQAHKVRNFYNNILVPTSDYPFVTIDTWAVNASYLLPGAAESKMVKGGVAENGAPTLGIHGGYILHAIAAIDLAKELSQELGYKVHPREVQSVTWEAIRALFDEDKKGNKELEKQTRNLKRQWQRGKITIDEYHRQVEQLWGGFNTPEWALGEGAGNAAQQGVVPPVPEQRNANRDAAALGGPAADSGRDPGADSGNLPATVSRGQEGRGPAPDAGAGRARPQEERGGGVVSLSPATRRQNRVEYITRPDFDPTKNREFARIPKESLVRAALGKRGEGYWAVHRKLPEGTPIEVRIDVPTYNRTKGLLEKTPQERAKVDPEFKNIKSPVFAVVAHEPTPPGKLMGTRIGYDTAIRIKNPVFSVTPMQQRRALEIKNGAQKTPLSSVKGEYVRDQSIPDDIETWTAVGYDPKEHSFYYDKATDEMVVSGEDAYHVGNTVFVKNPVYGNREQMLYSPATRRKSAAGSGAVSAMVDAASKNGVQVTPDFLRQLRRLIYLDRDTNSEQEDTSAATR